MSPRSPHTKERPGLPALVAALVGLCLGSACGGGGRGHAGERPQAGSAGAESGLDAGGEDPPPDRRPAVEGALELTLATPTGQLVFVGDLRGRPILLYFFATFDVASQANLTPLESFTRAHPEVRVIAVAIQPDARVLLDAWVHALSPSFQTTYDPDDAISGGTTILGPVGVPTYVLLDADGVPRAAAAGVHSRATLEEMLTRLPRDANGR